MPETTAVRWGILGTANIARSSFLPALEEAGGGRAVVVGGRDGARAAGWAEQHGVAEGVAGYDTVLGRDDVDAVYIPLPNNLHAEWTLAAIEGGKAVLCEKPLCTDALAVESVAAAARERNAAVWEAFVFPFQAQHHRILELIADGAIGEVREIVAGFHFPLSDPADIRMSPEMGGGAIADVGCYPVRFAQELFGAPTGTPAVAGSGVVEQGVEVDAGAVMTWADGRRLLLTCGFRRAADSTARILGTTGQLEVTNPYHPGPDDTLVLRRRGADPVVERPTTDRRSFTAALRHIHAVVGGDAPPLHLAADDSPPTARMLDALVAACRRPVPNPLD